MKVAVLTTDSREHFCDYSSKRPSFGTAPQGLLAGFADLARTTHLKQVLPPFEIHVISCTQQPMTSPEKLSDNVWFHSLHVPKWGWLKTGYLGCILAVRKKLREVQPDLVHAQGTERDCAISAVFTPYPKILTIHGNLRLIRKSVGFPPFSALWIQSFLEGFVVPRFDGVVCITNYTKRAVEKEAKRTWVIPNAVDPAFLALGDKRGMEDDRLKMADGALRTGEEASMLVDEGWKIEDGSAPSSNFRILSPARAPLVLVVANVDTRKNQNALILALDSLAQRRPFCLRFFGRCGEDEYGREFQRLVSARSWCEYGGMIGREALRAQFENAFALILPTQEDNCPMVVLEAQAAGVPVIASNVGGIPDLVENEVTGLMVDPNDGSSMARAMETLLTDAQLVFHLVANGRRKAKDVFHPLEIARQHLAVYREISGLFGKA